MLLSAPAQLCSNEENAKRVAEEMPLILPHQDPEESFIIMS